MRIEGATEFKCPGCGHDCVVGYTSEGGVRRLYVNHSPTGSTSRGLPTYCKDFQSRAPAEFVQWANTKLAGG